MMDGMQLITQATHFSRLTKTTVPGSFDVLKQVADDGDPLAQLKVGEMLLNGVRGAGGVAKNAKLALSYFKKSAEQGNGNAMYYVGWLCEQGGDGIKVDVKTADYYYRESERTGNPVAWFRRFYMHLRNGDRIPDELHAQIVQWFHSTNSENWNDQDLFCLGELHRLGLFCDKESELAIEYYKLSAGRGNSEAWNSLACIYKEQGNNKDAFACFNSAAHQGNAVALNKLGEMYKKGLGIEQDNRAAFRCYKQSAKQGNADGQYHLGVAYLKGHGVERNEKRAFEYIELSANQGHPDAQSQLRSMYLAGLGGVKQSYQQGMELLQLSADQGSKVAYQALAKVHLYGLGVPENTEKAIEYWKCSNGLSQDHEMSEDALMSVIDMVDDWNQFFVGWMHLNGKINGADKDKALMYIETSANQGNADAQYFIWNEDKRTHRHYLELSANQGHAVAQCELGQQMKNRLEDDDVEGRKIPMDYIKRSADQGYIEAQYYIGRGAIAHPSVDDKERLRYLTLSADRGHASAAYVLAGKYDKSGQYDLAFKYFQISANNGNTLAQYMLGYYFLNGQGVMRSEKDAFKYFHLSAGQGNAPAQCYLGMLYEKAGDKKNARIYFTSSAIQHNADALYRLGCLSGDREKIQYFQAAADRGQLDACSALGQAYLKGSMAVEKDEHRAFGYFKRSAQQGNAEGMYHSALMMKMGVGVEQNSAKADKLFGELFDHFQKRPPANAQESCLLAGLYFRGFGTSQNTEQGLFYLRQSLQDGFVQAQYEYGMFCLNSEEQSIQAEGREYLELAAKQGHKGAQNKLKPSRNAWDSWW